MAVRTWLGTKLIGIGRKIGRGAGGELSVTLSDHSIQTKMVQPDQEKRAWDSSLYKRGNVFLAGYANPIKPRVKQNKELENPDSVDIEEGEGTEEAEEDRHSEVISSPRYQEYMRQDLISQLLNPREQWRLIAYAVIALSILMLINVLVSASAAGLL